jgi:Protein of unknown function (DUF1997)
MRSDISTEKKPKIFRSGFQGYMDLHSDPLTVAEYLDAHQGWFCRCAKPMNTVTLGDDQYLIVIGNFGALGYEIEPKMAVVLHRPKNQVYLMHSIPINDSPPRGYEIDYRATMRLEELNCLSTKATRVIWNLDLKVAVEFPKFIDRLPHHIVQSSGERLLDKIVHQVSQKLTYRVQQDFHTTHSLPMPPKSSRGTISQDVYSEIPV